MVPPDSHRITRVPWYSGAHLSLRPFRLQGFHLLRLAFPDHLAMNSGPMALNRMGPTTPTPKCRFGLFPVRSPLLGESLLISFPSGTEMFHFPEFASVSLQIQMIPFYRDRVSPFGYPRIIGCLLLPEAFRRWPRPSSLPDAKASIVRPYFLDLLSIKPKLKLIFHFTCQRTISRGTKAPRDSTKKSDVGRF